MGLINDPVGGSKAIPDAGAGQPDAEGGPLPMDGMQPEMDGEELEGAEEMTPEEEEWADAVDKAVSAILYEEGGMGEEITQRLAQAEQPAIEVGQIAADLVIGVDEQMKGQVPEGVVIPATTNAVARVQDLGESLELFDLSEAETNQAITQAWSQVFDHYGIDPEDIQEGMSDMDEQSMQNVSQALGG